MNMNSFFDEKNPLSPWYRIEIKTPAQARLYNRLLVAKIVGQLIVLGVILGMAGWSLKALGFGLAIAVAWYGFDVFRRRRAARNRR